MTWYKPLQGLNIWLRSLWVHMGFDHVELEDFVLLISSFASGLFPPLIYYIMTPIFPLFTHPTPPSISPFYQTNSSCVSLQKRTGLPGIWTQYSITSYNTTRHTPSYKAWARQLRRRKMVPNAGKRITVCSQCYESLRIPSCLFITYMQSTYVRPIQTLCCSSFCKTLGALNNWFCGLCCSVLDSSDPYNPSSSCSQWCPELHLVFDYVSLNVRLSVAG